MLDLRGAVGVAHVACCLILAAGCSASPEWNLMYVGGEDPDTLARAVDAGLDRIRHSDDAHVLATTGLRSLPYGVAILFYGPFVGSLPVEERASGAAGTFAAEILVEGRRAADRDAFRSLVDALDRGWHTITFVGDVTGFEVLMDLYFVTDHVPGLEDAHVMSASDGDVPLYHIHFPVR